jgi:hypothetical protein
MAETTSLHLRLPKGLYKRLQRQARRNNVSLNTEIVNQLEGYDAATAARMAEAMKPALDDAIETALERVTRRYPSREEIMLDMIMMGPPTMPPTPRTEAELEGRLRQMGFSSDESAKFLQLFREIHAGTRLPAQEQIRRRDAEQK